MYDAKQTADKAVTAAAPGFIVGAAGATAAAVTAAAADSHVAAAVSIMTAATTLIQTIASIWATYRRDKARHGGK